MSDDLVIVPSAGDGYTELARTRSGRLFRKHILNKGPLLHPKTGEHINIDDKFVDTLKRNFSDNVCDIVQVPLAGDKNEHTEAPDRNIGEVIGIEEKGDKVYVLLDARDDKHADRLGKTLLGASAMLHLDYTNTKTGKKVGPTLLHTCVTNRPYVTGLENYEEIVAATSDTSEGAVLLTTDVVETEAPSMEETDMGDQPNTAETAPKPSLEELLTTLKTEHNIDVSALQAKAAEGDQAASLSKALVDALADSGVVKLAASDDSTAPVSTETVVTAVAELAQNNIALSNRVQSLERSEAETVVDGLIKAGRIKPAKREFYVNLRLSQPAVFTEVVPEEPIVALNNETGVTPKDDEAHAKDIDAEVARLSSLLGTTNK